MQITAEQILREARERQEDENYTAPAQKITDPEELAVYRLKERKHFEDRLRMSKHAVGTWLTVAFLPSMGLPKLPIRATTPPKDVVNALGAEVLASLAAAAPKPEEASSSQAAGEYWEVQDGAKRVKKAPKAAMHSGHTML